MSELIRLEQELLELTDLDVSGMSLDEQFELIDRVNNKIEELNNERKRINIY